ncbi:hypothetical protein GH714_032083 [Hevea brasiliensis]|uniref:Aminotransferase-like plant mobile domain-containing protein n=1 Tax=Hevea brasiliensis TaxID=3981 RepID=A0A6A6KMC8_HEVBR|nr:hypothetical protein GH714_032083 [Hevea brasiliensis]
MEAREKVYLAIFLACWLCKFVLPGEDVDLIRPSTFKVASMKATGRHFCLVVSVLASIYNVFREISTTSDLSTCIATFLIHHVYGWLANNFGTHYISKRNSYLKMTIYLRFLHWPKLFLRFLIDTSIPKEQFEGLLKSIDRVKELESFFPSSMLSYYQVKELEKLRGELDNSLTFEKEATSKFSSSQIELIRVNEELKELNAKKERLVSSLEGVEKELQNRKIDVSRIQEKISNFENTLVHGEVEEQALQ